MGLLTFPRVAVASLRLTAGFALVSTPVGDAISFLNENGMINPMQKASISFSIEKSCNDFIAEVTPHLAQACKIPEEKIISDFYFDKRTNEVKGMIQIPEPAKESVIDQLYYYGKAAWRNQKSEPNAFHLFIAD